MTAFLFLVAFVGGLIIGYSLISRRPKQVFFAVAEYWVFLPGEVMPSQDAVMTRMISTNPYSRRGQSPVGPAEGLVFSDVRLHIALILRKKNPHAFRRDRFEPDLALSEEQAAAVENAQSFVKLRYLSDRPLQDRRHLQFLIHSADAFAALGEGTLIYDHTAECLWTPAELAEELRSHFDATGPELNTNIVWTRAAGESFAETRGLRKIGHPELKANLIELDQRVLIQQILELTIERIWGETELPPSVEVSAFDDKFRVDLHVGRDRIAIAHILRIQTA